MMTSTLIGSDKGGVGKSLVSQIAIVAHDQASQPLGVIEIDHRRKLSTIFHDRVNLSVPPIGAIDPRLRSATPYNFSVVYDEWMRKNSLTDLGANVSSPLFEWMRKGAINRLAEEDGIVFRFVSVTSPDDQAIRSSFDSLLDAKETLGPSASLFLVLNDMGGVSGFAPYEKTEIWRDLMRRVDALGVQVINIPCCQSGILDYGRARGHSIADMLDASSQVVSEICREAGYNRVDRHIQFNAFLDWVEQVQTALVPLFQKMLVEQTSSRHTDHSKIVTLRNVS
jgi:hypothetical protein